MTYKADNLNKKNKILSESIKGLITVQGEKILETIKTNRNANA